MDPTSAPYVVLGDIPSTGSQNIILTPVPYAITNHSPSGTYLLTYSPPGHSPFSLQTITNITSKRTIWTYKFLHLLKPRIELILNYNYILPQPYSLFLQSRLYTTIKYISLLLYPTFLYLIQHHLQLYLTSPIIWITQWIHNFPFRYHINRHSWIPYYTIHNTDTKKNFTDDSSMIIPTKLYTSVCFIRSSMHHTPYIPICFTTPIMTQ